MKEHSDPNEPNREWLVPEVAPGERRLDRFLQSRLPRLSRRMWQELFAAGKIRMNQRIAAKGDSVKSGDRINVNLPTGLDALPLADPSVRFTVPYQDPDLLVVDKPGLIPTHPLKVWERGTLANGLVSRFPELRGVGPEPLEPGLVHRLDTGTSGLLLVARQAEARERLKKDLARRRWTKKYLALVRGRLEREETITAPLAHHPGDRKKMMTVSADSPPPRGRVYRAETRVRPRQHWPEATLVEVDLVTGVMHQIRVHLAGRGYPVIGDRLYGPENDAVSPLATGRHFLHAHFISFDQPLTGERLSCSSPLPDDLQEALASLGPALD
ncbi:MAG: RluA family pseudouridine synthase [Deltaproteobacteria bacterium]|nr:RluA family pseudouridine synthase [Deltaproteobacteria bacterium]